MVFKVPSRFLVVPGRLLWSFKVSGWFFMVQSGFLLFLRFQVVFLMVTGRILWYFMVPGYFYGYSWFHVRVS